MPVTVKMRVGIDAEHVTYREAGLRAQDAGVALRRAARAHRRWSTTAGTPTGRAIAELVELLDIPVLGNGDIWEADDALRMVRETGCAGVVVGRGCLGRPWLFADLAAAFAGARTGARARRCGRSRRSMRRHAELLAEWLGEQRGVTEFRKHVAWYLKGFASAASCARRWRRSSSLAELDDLLGRLDADQPFPESSWVSRAGARPAGAQCRCPRAGWTHASPARCRPGPSSTDSGG